MPSYLITLIKYDDKGDDVDVLASTREVLLKAGWLPPDHFLEMNRKAIEEEISKGQIRRS